jgi:hypothetical protein
LAASKRVSEALFYGSSEAVSNVQNVVVVTSLGSSKFHVVKPKPLLKLRDYGQHLLINIKVTSLVSACLIQIYNKLH